MLINLKLPVKGLVISIRDLSEKRSVLETKATYLLILTRGDCTNSLILVDRLMTEVVICWSKLSTLIARLEKLNLETMFVGSIVGYLAMAITITFQFDQDLLGVC